MAEIFGIETGLSVPQFLSGSGSFNLILFIIGIFIIVALMGFTAYLIFQWRVYRFKIVLFENTGEGFRPIGKDKARLIKIGNGGEEILKLKLRKVYRTAYGRKMGKNTYWFAIGQDGYWYNITLADLDAKMGALDIEPIDRDMRYMHVALRKNAEERYTKKGIWEQYGGMIISGIFLLIMLVALFFLIDQIGELLKSSQGVANSMKDSIDIIKQALAQADASSGSSGIVSA